jgi:hypothetical protein
VVDWGEAGGFGGDAVAGYVLVVRERSC